MRWYTAFQSETPTPSTEVVPLVRERIDDRRLWLWEDGTGTPVSLAARTPSVAGVARIAPVYTPKEHRRHGYATALTAACTPTRSTATPIGSCCSPTSPTRRRMRCTSGSGSAGSADARS